MISLIRILVPSIFLLSDWASRNSRAGMQHPPSNPHYSHALQLSTLGCVAQPCLRCCSLRPPYLIIHMML